MRSFLENKTTNPLIMAMAAEKVKTKATFNKWKDIILGIIGEYVFIETFASGLFEKDDYNSKKIAKQYEEIEEILKEWEDGYKVIERWLPYHILIISERPGVLGRFEERL